MIKLKRIPGKGSYIEIELEKLLREQMPYLIVLVLLVMAHLQLGWYVFDGFLAGMTVYVWGRYDSRIPIGLALILLVMAAVTLAFGGETFANQLATYTYYFLVMGVALQAIDYFIEGDVDEKTEY